MFNTKSLISLVSVGLIFINTKALSFQFVEPTPLLAGPYLGSFIGAAFGNNKVNTSLGSVSSTSYFTSQADINTVAQNNSATLNPNGFMVGVKGGDDWIFGNKVIGAIVDYGYFPQHSNMGSTQAAYPDGSGNYSISTALKTDWLFMLRGRAGRPFNFKRPGLLYATAGMAITKLSISNEFSDTTVLSGTNSSSIGANQIGFAVGGGLDFSIKKDLFFNIEYLYIGLPALTMKSRIYNAAEGFGINADSLANPISIKSTLSSNLLRIGLHYKFS